MISNNQGAVCKLFIEFCLWVVKRDESGKNDPVYKASRYSTRLDSSEKSAKFFRGIWDKTLISEQEQVNVIFVDEKLRPIKWHCIHTGGVCETILDTRVIINYVTKYKPFGLLMAHNHPMGGLKPSQNDLVMTDDVRSMCKLVKIKFLDHIILTEKAYFSFKEDGIID